MSGVLRQGIVAAGSVGNPDLNEMGISNSAIRFWWHNNQADGLKTNTDGSGVTVAVGDMFGSIVSGSGGGYTYRLERVSGIGSQPIRHADGFRIQGAGGAYRSTGEIFPGSVTIYPKTVGIVAGMRFKFLNGPVNNFPLGNATLFAQDDSPAVFCFQGVTSTRKLGAVADSGTSLLSATDISNLTAWTNVIAYFLPGGGDNVLIKLFANRKLIGSGTLSGAVGITRHIIQFPVTFYTDMVIQSTFFIEGSYLNNLYDLDAFLTQGIPV